jgi:ribose 5-phosphate isomerase RpiB
MIVALGNDHAGFPLKAYIRGALERLGHQVIDVGTHEFSTDPDCRRRVRMLHDMERAATLPG